MNEVWVFLLGLMGILISYRCNGFLINLKCLREPQKIGSTFLQMKKWDHFHIVFVFLFSLIRVSDLFMFEIH